MPRFFRKITRLFYREPDFYVGGRANPYMKRWWVIPRNRFFNIYLHQFLRDDDDRALHDHPWYSLSIILRVGYIEHLPNRIEIREGGDITFRKAKQAHRIELYTKADGTKLRAWTLFITGPRIRDWGFHCSKGWVHWKNFVDESDHGNVGKGCGE